jgi:Dolichyl-phosphate-mannose-protein mannosyltransferase
LVNATKIRSWCGLMLLAALVLTAAAWLRGAEYDEQYTLFLTAGTARPDWPETVFPAGLVASVQSGHASLSAIARDLRATDVHPPLYFWAAALWRDVFGSGLFAVRMLSVLCGMVSLGLVGVIAGDCRIPRLPAMLLTLGCYGFVYTNAIARGFAPAQMLTLFGVMFQLRRRPFLAGACLGAACCCNYLAVFVAFAAILAVGAWRAVPAMIPFLALDGWFFAAQHGARPNQFPRFEFWSSLVRLAEYQTAAVFGGLPLYVDGVWRVAVKAGVGLAAAALILFVGYARPWKAERAIRMLLAAALASPAGLLLLGAVFDNTPIELRYLSFGLPFIALLVAGTSRPGVYGYVRDQHDIGAKLIALTVTIQLASISGLLLSQRTMQPARAAAIEAAALAGDGIVLLPRGNDGVGIVGAFATEAPPSLPLLLIGSGGVSAAVLGPYRRAVLVLLAQDRDSTAAIPEMRAALAVANWRRVRIGSKVEVYERSDFGE